jgi:tricarboxylate carrier
MAADAGFDPSRPRYDQSHFGGRFRHFLDIADPRCLAPSLFFGMSLEESVGLMDQHRRKTLPANVTAEQLWLAKKIRDSAIHPDTGETVLQPFRMSGFAIYGTPIVVGMLLPNPTMASTVFFQALNQTHNACVNYANRNASQPTKTEDLVTGYLGAVAASVSIAVGLNQLVKRARITEQLRTMLSRFVPYPAVATASTANMLLMRRTELKNGIAIKDHEGTVHGFSQKAAETAIFQTMLSRVVLPAPLLLIPPLAMMAIEKTPLLRLLPRARLPVEATVCVLSFVFGLPFAISLFPQEGSIPSAQAEDRFRQLRDSKGQPIPTFYFNKGL